jgi:hypothetical protein
LDDLTRHLHRLLIADDRIEAAQCYIHSLKTAVDRTFKNDVPTTHSIEAMQMLCASFEEKMAAREHLSTVYEAALNASAVAACTSQAHP